MNWRVLAALLAVAPPAHAQIDYRNLDDDRPVRVEDATPIERYAFEFLFPYALEREKGGGFVHAVIPELAYGLFPNVHIGVKAPVALRDAAGTTDVGLAGIRAFALVQVAGEGPILPAIALRVDGEFPVGALAGSDSRAAAKAILTRSFGRYRLHGNAAYRVGRDGTPGLVESLPRWWAGVAVDHTFFRESLLLVAETSIERAQSGAPLDVTGALGVRWQWSPVTVLDVGISRGLRANVGHDVAVTIGLSHVFALRALMPAGR